MVERYQLRKAAGMFWLLDMSQNEPTYKKPVCMNESGAYFWELISKGFSKEMIIEHLCNEFGLDAKEATEDVETYFRNLKQNGISV